VHIVYCNQGYQVAALEPAAEWYQDVMLDSFYSEDAASSSEDSDSDGSAWEEVTQPAA
jgi:hypothetical protein